LILLLSIRRSPSHLGAIPAEIIEERVAERADLDAKCGGRPQRSRLPPVTVMTAPVTVATVESVAVEKPEPRSVEAIARPDEEAEANRRTVVDWPGRRRCVGVSRRGSAVRLHHISAPRARARSRSKPECEDRQGGHSDFLPHNRFSLLLYRRIEPPARHESCKKNRRRRVATFAP
jgi:hypothetical protein